MSLVCSVSLLSSHSSALWLLHLMKKLIVREIVGVRSVCVYSLESKLSQTLINAPLFNLVWDTLTS